jgi:hypothetical protein
MFFPNHADIESMPNAFSKILAGFSFLLLIYPILFLVTLGTDMPSQVHFRMLYGALLAGLFIFLISSRKSKLEFTGYFSAYGLGLFLIFELIRFFWATWRLRSGIVVDEETEILKRFGPSVIPWVYAFVFFIMSLSFFKSREEVRRLLWVIAAVCFFMAMNVIPTFLLTGNIFYQVSENEIRFFYSALHFHAWISKYILGFQPQVNWTGDMIAVGFFASVALFLYALPVWKQEERRPEQEHFIAILGLAGLFASVIILAVVMFNSRGTILSVVLATVLFTVLLLIKFRSGKILSLMGLILVCAFGLLIWAGNPQGTWKELQTLQSEVDPEKDASMQTNREGATRALAIYRDYPFWGVGQHGYAALSMKYATPGREGDLLAKFRVMSHYLQLLAEEGVGTFLYYFFLLAYLFDFLIRFFKTRSVFESLSGLGLFSAVFMILIHAAINHLMQNFVVSMLVYMLMGASLGLFQSLKTGRDTDTLRTS